MTLRMTTVTTLLYDFFKDKVFKTNREQITLKVH